MTNIYSLTTSIEQEIIVLLNKKYNITSYIYDDTRSYYNNNINKEIFVSQINYKNNDLNYSYKDCVSINNINNINNIDTINKIINIYLDMDGYLCYYDLDIFNLIIKYILINRPLPEIINTEVYSSSNQLNLYNMFNSISYFHNIYSYFGGDVEPIKKNMAIKKDLNYFNNIYINIGLHDKVKLFFFYIVNEIIIPFTTYELI